MSAYSERALASASPWPWLITSLGVGAIIGVGVGVDARIAAFAAIAGAAIVALLLRPELLPSALVVTVFIEGIALSGVQISRLMGPIAIVVVLVALLTRGRVTFPSKRILIAVGAYATWAFASALWTAAPRGTAFALASLALSVIFLVAVAVLVERREDVRRLMVVVWGMSVLVGLVALAEYLVGSGRSVGYTDDPNFFAATQVISIPIGVALVGNMRTAGQRAIVVAGLAVVMGSVVTSLSRGGLLALLAMVVLIAVWPARSLFRTRARKRAFLAASLIGAVLLLFAAYGDLSQRTSSLFNSAEGGSGRENLWHAAIAGWQEHPVRGLGYGAFESQSNDLLQRTPGVDFSAYLPRPEGQAVHNAYLSSLVQVGIVGLALFVAILMAMFATLREVAKRADDLQDALLGTAARALMLSLAGFAMISLFLSSELDRALWIPLGLTLALFRLVALPRETPVAHR